MIRTLSALLAVSLCFSGAAYAQQPDQSPQSPITQSAPQSSKNDSLYEQLNVFGEVLERIRTDYVKETNEKDLIEAAINGMLTSLDPHSAYHNAEDFKNMQVELRGEFGGLGIEVTMENGLIKIMSPIDDTPASRAGLLSGDFITHIDDKPVVGMALDDAVKKMRGPVNTKVTLTIRRGEQAPFDVTLTRDTIEIQSVKSEVIDQVGYVRVRRFNENTFTALKTALDAIEKKTPAVLGYILDLRNNPGGPLDQAVSVSDAFLEEGEIVSTRGRDPKDIQRFFAKKGDLTNGKPVVVLINEGSASASEIVAGALKDQGRAILIGEKSFGKGSVQSIMAMPGHGAIRLTTALYYTPSGVSIQATGITPDIIVPIARLETLNYKANRESDLIGAIKNGQTPAKDQETPENKDIPQNNTPKEDPNPKNDNGKDKDKPEAFTAPEKPADDYQVSRGVDLVKALALYNRQKK
jgi:carboxyl-terminal processing protease